MVFEYLLQGEFQDLLFLLTARYHVAVLSYDADSRDVVTRAYGNVKVSLLVLLLHLVHSVH